MTENTQGQVLSSGPQAVAEIFFKQDHSRVHELPKL